MFANPSLRARLLLLFAALLAAALAIGIGTIVLSAGPRVRAEADSATRLSREFVETAIAGLAQSPDPAAAVDRLLDDFRNLRHVRISIEGEGTAAKGAPAQEEPDWFEKLIGARPSVTRVTLDLPNRPRAAIAIVTNPDDEVAEIWDDLVRFAVGGGALALAAFALIGFLVTRSLRPVDRISAGLAGLERGDYDLRVEADGPADFVGMAARLNALAGRLGELSHENRALGQRIVHAQDEERREIARDLHDEIGPSLFAIRAGLAALARKAEAGPLDTAAVTQATRAIGAQVEVLQRLNRGILGRLRPAALGELGLTEALHALVRAWRDSAPEIDAHLDIAPEAQAVDETIALTVYRIVQEALTNIIRHAGATRADIAISVVGGRLGVRIADDGAGFDADAAWGFGLKGMNERVAALGGRLALLRSADGGAVVSADLPLRSD